MRKPLLFTAAAASLAFSASAQTPREHRAQFNAVADAISSAATCKNYHGFEVDLAGIMQWRDRARDAAVTDEFTAPMAEAAIQQEIDAEVANQAARFRRAKALDHVQERVMEFRTYWSRRCKNLAKGEYSAAFFTLPD